MGMLAVGATVGACGPVVDEQVDASGGDVSSGEHDDETETSGADGGSSASHGASGGGDPSTTASTSTGSGAGTTNDGSHDTDYPVDPGCDEGDEGWDESDAETGGSGSSGGAEDTGIGMGGDFPLSATVFELRMGFFESGELVEVTNAIVTTQPVAAPDGFQTLLFVQDPAGGAYSGINLRYYGAVGAGLVPGDRITVTGHFVERYVFSTIEVETIEVTGTGVVPEPVLVTPDMVSAGGELAESLESALVEIQQTQVVDPMVCPGEVLVQATLKVDDRFLVAAGDTLPAPASGVYTRVAGPLIYTYTGFEIAPRTLADLDF